MHEAALVCSGQAVRDLRGELQRLAHRHGAGVHQLAQRLPVDVLHGHERAAVVIAADLVDRHDVRVVQRRRGARFVAQAEEMLGRLGQMGGEELDRDVPPEVVVVREEDFAHSSGAELANDAIRSDGLGALRRWYRHDSSPLC